MAPTGSASAGAASSPSTSASTGGTPPKTWTTAEVVARFGLEGTLRTHAHREVRAISGRSGDVWWFAFTPADPVPATAPVVLFHHGWDGVNPKFYGAWIDHLVREGNLVVFPIYQPIKKTPPRAVTANAAAADRAALAALAAQGAPKPDLARVAAIGFSMGATISANLAASAASLGLPPLRALLLSNPGDARHVATGPDAASIQADYAKVPADTVVITVVGEHDPIARKTGPELHARLTAVALRRCYYLHGDRHGSAELKAGHLAPTAFLAAYDFAAPFDKPRVVPAASGYGGGIDAFDLFGYWKWSDLALGAAFAGGRDLDDPVVGTSMGAWPDGAPIRAASVGRETCPLD